MIYEESSDSKNQVQDVNEDQVHILVKHLQELVFLHLMKWYDFVNAVRVLQMMQNAFHSVQYLTSSYKQRDVLDVLLLTGCVNTEMMPMGLTMMEE